MKLQVGRSAHRLSVSTRRHAEAASEQPRHVALIGKATVGGRFGKLHTASDQLARAMDAPLHDVGVGSQAGRARETTQELISTQLGFPGQGGEGQDCGRIVVDQGTCRCNSGRHQAPVVCPGQKQAA